MSRLPIFLLSYSFVHASAAAQTALSLSSTSAPVGTTATLNLSLASPAGSEPSAIQWNLNYPPASLSKISLVPGNVLASAGKTLQCVLGIGSFTCIAYGMNESIIPNGVVAQVMANPVGPGTVAMGISAPSAVSPAGDSEATTGTGGNITETSLPSITLNPSSLTFPPQHRGTTSAAQSVTVTNNGNSPVTFSSIALTGANPGDYAISADTCPVGAGALAASASCSVSIRFSPTAIGTRTGAVTFTDNAVGSPQSAGLSGTGSWYMYKGTFTVAVGQVPNAQTNFPALISGTFADFATIANGGKVANTCTQTVGNHSIAVPCDLIFSSDPAGSVPLNWEFETYNAATGAVNIWVNVPLIGDGTVIYGWYGDPTVTTLQTTPSATWNSDFEAVYHLSEIPTDADPQMNDSTANANHATMNGTILSSQQQPGVVGGGINFEGNTYATLANAEKFNFQRTDSFALSGWFKLPSGQSSYSSTLLSKFPSTPDAGWALVQGPNGPAPSAFGLILVGNGGGNGLLADTPGVTTGVWHYLVATYSGTSTVAGVQIFVDGVSQPLTALANNLSNSTINNLTPQMNGTNGNFQLSMDSMDEIRISAKHVVFTPGWVIASYNNQSNPGAFFSVATGLTN